MAKHPVKKFRKSGPAAKKSLNWLWGRSSVFGTVNSGRWRVYELFVTSEVYDQNVRILTVQKANGIELEVVSNDKLSELCQATDHQGIVARVSKYPYDTLENFENAFLASDTALPSAVKPIAVVMDRIQDTFNFASLLRSCDHAGVGFVFVGEHCQSQVTTQVARLCSGAVNHVSIVQSSELQVTAKRLKELGLTLIAADPSSSQSVDNAVLDGPLGFLVGSDLSGLDPNLMALSDQRVCIPGSSHSTLLSPSVSTGVLLYETRRRQRLGT